MDSNTNRSYRIRTKVGDNDGVLKIDMPLVQTYDTFEILSLKLNQKNQYNYYDSNYGVIVGRVLANENFGIPNAKISIFIPVDDNADLNERILYNFASVRDTNFDNVRYNLLPDFVDAACHQDVGTFPNKRLVLDNNDVIEIFDKYYKYTTTTNQSGDYMLFGVPVGSQNLHVDIDLSDIGTLSQRPRDMVYKGYNINQFDSPNKFKTSTNLNSLSQIYSQDKGIYCYPYWGNSNNDNENGTSHIAITRCDIQIDYKFEPTAIFMGSIVTDKGSNAIGKNCTGTDTVGKMADLATGEGTIEMIRKTIDNKVEQFQIKGDRLIDSDGVWCYQIPMNLDYMMTDEFGNMVPTDDPSKGIPTRTRVRFRISLDENPNDATAHKRCRFLVPNNPSYVYEDKYPEFHRVKEADYEFGSSTRDESYCDMFWNNVYTVKSYIPRLQKNNNTTNRKHTGIKMVNHYGDNNPLPYNSLSIKLGFTFRLICIITKIIIYLIAFLNMILGIIMTPFCLICSILKGLGKIPLVGFVFKALSKPFCALVFSCIELSSEFCDDGINKKTYYPGCIGCQWDETKRKHNEKQNSIDNPEEMSTAENPQFTNIEDSTLVTCVENQLAQDNEATSFNFQNDWINGVLYAPLWYRKIKKKRSFLFGLIKRRAKDEWCRADSNFNLMIYQACTLEKTSGGEIKSWITGEKYSYPTEIPSSEGCEGKKKCGENKTTIKVDCGLINTKETMLGESVYYYKAINYNYEQALKRDGDGVILLFATDIVLLGSLNDCDLNGIPQFFKNLDSTTYNMPTDILFTDTIIQLDADGNVLVNANNDIMFDQFTEATGCDWGNLNSYDECGKQGDGTDGGLFYGIGCSSIEMMKKSCLNLPRICEYGVSLDEAKDVTNLANIGSDDNPDNTDVFERLTPDGFVSFDELYNVDERSMFATLNGNRLRTRLNSKNGLKEYDLRYLYVDNFDGLLKDEMKNVENEKGDCNYKNNFNLERFSRDYYIFRMGTDPFYYDGSTMKLPRYENSFYFYFGLKMGKTAIDKFNSQFYSQCEDTSNISSPVRVELKSNSWCEDDGYIYLDLKDIDKPCTLMIRSLDGNTINETPIEINEDYVFYYKVDDNENCEEDVKNKFKEIYGITEGEIHPLCDMIPNGKYEYVITDANGDIISDRFELKKKYLVFNYTKKDFIIPNNQKNQECDNNIEEILKQYEKYEGYITITSITNGENTIGIYRIDIEPKNENIFGYPKSFRVEVKENGSFSKIDEISPYAIVLEDKIIIPTPKGNQDYELTVSYLCEGEIGRGNTVTNTITINDPMPFKLFINDVDISVFKPEYFDTGWDENILNKIGEDYEKNDKTEHQEGTYIDVNINEQGWLNLSNKKIYDWTKLEEYNEAETEEEREAIQESFISLVKETFWLTCPSSYKDLIFTVQTNNLPVEYHILGNEEEVDEDKDYVGKLLNESNLSDFEGKSNGYTTSSINSIFMPTITTVDNEDYGYDVDNTGAKNGKGICFAYDRINGYDSEKNEYLNKIDGEGKWFKKPYGIWIKDSKGGVLLTKDEDKEDEEIRGKYFYFHIIDKTLRFNLLSWSYIDNIPYFILNDTDERIGKSIKMNGFVTGYIYNGIAPLSVSYAGKEYKTYSEDDEDAMPTKRTLINEESIYKEYIDEDGLNLPYIEVPNRKLSFTIEDNSCTLDETIYGNMKLVLNDSSLNDCKNNIKTFNINVNNGDNNNDNLIFVIKLKKIEIEKDGKKVLEWNYPLNNITNGIFIPNNVEGYGVLDYNIKITDLKDEIWCDKSFEAIDYDDDGNLITERKGWSESGNFNCNISYPIYAIGVTSNNCRALSPVYDYSEISINMELAKSEEGDNILRITLDDKDNKVKNYYIKNYSFKIQANIGITSAINTEEKTIEANIFQVPKENNQKLDENNSTNSNDLFYYENGNEFTVYNFDPEYSIGTSSEVTTSGVSNVPTDPFAIGEDEWAVFKYNENGQIIGIENVDAPADGIGMGNGGTYSNYYSITTVINEETGETETKWYEQTISYKRFEELYTSEDDPSSPHYKRKIDFIITNQQNTQLQTWCLIMNNQLIEASNVYITDYTGLKHLAKINEFKA